MGRKRERKVEPVRSEVRAVAVRGSSSYRSLSLFGNVTLFLDWVPPRRIRHKELRSENRRRYNRPTMASVYHDRALKRYRRYTSVRRRY